MPASVSEMTKSGVSSSEYEVWSVARRRQWHEELQWLIAGRSERLHCDVMVNVICR